MLYKDQAPRGSRKIKGHFRSATANSLTLTLDDGQTHTLRKLAVRKVLTPPPGRETKVGTGLLVAFLVGMGGDFNSAIMPLLVSAFIGAPTAVVLLGPEKMGGIYNVPRKHRM